MRSSIFSTAVICFLIVACKKTDGNRDERPRSKTDYIPILSSITARNVVLGQPVLSRVKMGFYSYSADIRFLNFEVKETVPKQFDIRAKGFYDNINYDFALPVLTVFDTTLTIQAPAAGQYILKFYNAVQLVQTDTVQVN